MPRIFRHVDSVMPRLTPVTEPSCSDRPFSASMLHNDFRVELYWRFAREGAKIEMRARRRPQETTTSLAALLVSPENQHTY